MSSIRDEIPALKECALDLLIGEKLGGGVTRNVYALRYNPGLVIKVEYANKQFCNVAEYDVWNAVKDTKLAKYFAPVMAIDTWAGALIMKRTKPITEAEFRAEVKRIPKFMCDAHWGNFGRLNGQIVCHDYGYHAAISDAVANGQLGIPRRS